MIRDTRLAILETAKKLFNERGYTNVSTRDIADELSISKGNLTYYFKKKEEIIEAILLESPSPRILKAPENLAELNDFFNDIQMTVQENAFYFWHHAQLIQISSKIKEMQNDILQKNIEFMTQAFKTLTSEGILRDENSPGEYDRIVDAVLITSIYWIPFCKLKGEETPNSFSEQVWGILSSFLTAKGQIEFQKTI